MYSKALIYIIMSGLALAAMSPAYLIYKSSFCSETFEFYSPMDFGVLALHHEFPDGIDFEYIFERHFIRQGSISFQHEGKDRSYDIGALDWLNPLVPGFYNHAYVFLGGNRFLVYDNCGVLVRETG